MTETQTPRPWPANAQPTPEELAEWLSYALHHERLEFAKRACQAMGDASACFIEDHRGRLSLLDLTPGRGRHRRGHYDPSQETTHISGRVPTEALPR